MAHDRQIAEPDQENSNASSKQPRTCSDVVLFWLRLYAAMPYMREKSEKEQWDWKEIILFYDSSLGKLRSPRALHKAFEWCRDNVKFLPQPVEVLERYGIEVEALRPAALPESAPTQEEREAAIAECSADLRKKLGLTV